MADGASWRDEEQQLGLSRATNRHLAAVERMRVHRLRSLAERWAFLVDLERAARAEAHVEHANLPGQGEEKDRQGDDERPQDDVGSEPPAAQAARIPSAP